MNREQPRHQTVSALQDPHIHSTPSEKVLFRQAMIPLVPCEQPHAPREATATDINPL